MVVRNINSSMKLRGSTAYSTLPAAWETGLDCEQATGLVGAVVLVEPVSVTGIAPRSSLALSSIFTLVCASVSVYVIYACRLCSVQRQSSGVQAGMD